MSPEQLLKKASEVAKNGHAPYSNYQVGAALLCEDGTVFTGCNVENASFGLTNCAERTAVFSAIAAGNKKFSALAITAIGNETPFPCGACRQVLAEFCDGDFPVYIDQGNSTKTVLLRELLPYAFDFGASNG
jgi:cytidine deaminase